jgi:hypothetical protein
MLRPASVILAEVVLRAEIQSLVDQIQQSLALLRRHL